MRSASPQLPLFEEVEDTDFDAGLAVRRSKRARRLTIKVYPRGRVEVVVPHRASASTVREFVASHREWIHATRAAFAAEHPPEPFALPTSVRLPGVARAFCVRYSRDDGRSAVHYRVVGNTVVLSGDTGNEALCVAALKRWLTALGRKEYLPRLRALSAETGQAFRRLHVRGQRTCWGSHSGTGTISLNYCLMFLDPRLVRYVMIHELCHARHMDHSVQFWRLVGSFERDFRRLDKALNDGWKRIPAWVGIY